MTSRVPHSWVHHLLFALLVAGCATRPPGPTPLSRGARGPGDVEPWRPGPQAQPALEALWSTPAFALAPELLAVASGGPVARVHAAEVLLFESRLELDAAGRGVEVARSVSRLLNDAPNQTRVFTWSPWRQKRPIVRGRVVGPDGTQSWVQAADVIEGSVTVSGLELSDVRQLSVVLPNARLGSVVELEVTHEDTRPLLEGAGAMGSWALWSFEPVRRMRLSVEAPATVPLKVEAVGVPAPEPSRQGGTQRVAVDVGELRFSPFALTTPELRARAPRFAWSTADSWATVAQRYRRVLEPAFADRVDLASLEPALARATSRTERIEAVARWLAERVRYTAVHLGAGAIAPTAPSTVLARGFGDCKDLAVLATLALRRAGVAAEVALVMANGPQARDGAPGLGAFNHMIVSLPPDAPGGEVQWLDATAPGYPVGRLPAAVREQRALIITEGTTGLTTTPARAAARFAVTQRFELSAAPFGSGTGAATLAFADDAEGALRGAVGSCDSATAHELVEATVKKVLGDGPFDAELEGCRPGEGPLVVSVARHTLASLDTGDQKIEVRLPSRIVDEVLPDWLPGPSDPTDDRTEAQRRDQQQRTLDRTGHTEEELAGRAMSFESRPSIERVYRVTIPPRFALAALPPDRTLSMGPSSWSESFARLEDGTVEARFRFEVLEVDWSVAEVAAFREALRRRFEEPMPVVTAFFAPVERLRQRRPAEAMGLVKQWLTERPADAATRARYARLLVQLGLGEPALREAERAARDAPADALVAMVCGDVARRDAYGALYRPPFQREKALDCLRRAHRLDPDHSWAAVTLADTLRRNANGEPEAGWLPDVAEAAGILEAMVERHQAPRAAVEMLMELDLAAGRLTEAKALLEAQPSLKDVSGPLKVVLELLSGGGEAYLRRAERIAEPKERLTALAQGYGAYAYLRQYEEATAFLGRLSDDAALGGELAAMKELHLGLRRAPDAVDLSSPEAAARSVYAQLANASSPTDAARRLAALASSSGRAELDGAPTLFGQVRLPGLEQRFAFDQLFTRGQCAVDSRGPVSRVSCELPERGAGGSVSYWVLEGGALKLESLGQPAHLVERAWEAAQRSDVAAGAAWIGWIVDELSARRVDTGAAKVLRDFWAQAERTEPDSLRFAAAVARVVSTDLAEKAPPSVLATLFTGRARLTGALRRGVDATLVRTLDRQGQFDRAARVLEPLARAENEPWMWQYLATLQYKGTRAAEAEQRIDAALRKDPGNPQWREVKAFAALRRGRSQQAVDTLEALEREQVQGVDVRNNLVWARFLAGTVGEELEKEALRLAGASDASEASLHTAAMVLLERGRVLDAAELGEKRLRRLGGAPDEAQWLLRGRLGQLLGLTELAREAYAKASSGSDPELAVLAKRYLDSEKGR